MYVWSYIFIKVYNSKELGPIQNCTFCHSISESLIHLFLVMSSYILLLEKSD